MTTRILSCIQNSNSYSINRAFFFPFNSVKFLKCVHDFKIKSLDKHSYVSVVFLRQLLIPSLALHTHHCNMVHLFRYNRYNRTI